jgi:F-type H+-transporting ATPase subunit gamma
MANLKEIRTRIMSVQSTRQITSAMKMVSAAKLRKAQDAIIQMRPYANKLREILQNLTEENNTNGDIDNVYGKVRKVKKVLLVVISSNKGLCGAFNSNAVKKVIQLIKERYEYPYAADNVDIISIGKKGTELLKIRGYKNIENRGELLDDLTFENILPLAEKILNDFVNENYDEVKIIYNQFKNAAVQILVDEQFLPMMQVSEEEETEEEPYDFDKNHYDFILEPSKEYIIKEVIPKSLKIQLFKTLLDSVASEHGARMTAMHKATDNATDLIRELQLDYNKARQASITNEILEIVSGAEALKGK